MRYVVAIGIHAIMEQNDIFCIQRLILGVDCVARFSMIRSTSFAVLKTCGRHGVKNGNKGHLTYAY